MNSGDDTRRITRELEHRLAIKGFFIQEVLEKAEVLYG